MIFTCTFYICLKRRNKKEDDIETVVLEEYDENADSIAMQSLASSTIDINGIASVDATATSSERTDLVSNVSFVSYAPSNLEPDDEDDIGGFREHRWKKLIHATTTV